VITLVWLCLLAAAGSDRILDEAWSGTFSGIPFSKVPPSSLAPPLQRMALARLKSVQRGLILQSRDLQNPEETLRNSTALRSERPDDPMVYFVYAVDYSYAMGDLPPDFDETWRRIDPENATWPIMKAIQRAWRACGPDPARRKLIVKDQALFGEAVELIMQASHMPRLDDFTAAQLPWIRASMGTPHTAQEAHIMNTSARLGVREFVPQRLVRTELEQLEAGGDKEAMAAWLAAWRRCAMLASLTDSKTADSWNWNLLESAAAKAGLSGESARWNDLRRIVTPDRVWPPSPRVPAIADPETPPAAIDWFLQQEPQEQATRLAHLWVGFLAAATVSLLGLGVAWLLLLPPASAGARCAECLAALFDRRGWVKLALAGVLLPLVWGAGWALAIPAYELKQAETSAYSGALILIAVIASALCITQREISRRLAFLGLGAGGWRKKVALAMTTLALLSPVVLYLSLYLGHPQETPGCIDGGPILSGIACLWLTGNLAAAFFQRDAAIRRRIYARRMIPALTALTALLLLFMGGIALAERHLIARYPAPSSTASPDPLHAASLRALQAKWQQDGSWDP
jgi:hypothetical protein